MFLAMGNHLEPFSKVSDPLFLDIYLALIKKIRALSFLQFFLKKGHRLRTKITISLLEVVLGLLQPLHPVLDLQMDLGLLKVIPNDSLYP